MHLGTPNGETQTPFAHSLCHPLCQETVCTPIKMELVKMTPAQMPCLPNTEHPVSVIWLMRVVTMKRRVSMIETWQGSWQPYVPDSFFEPRILSLWESIRWNVLKFQFLIFVLFVHYSLFWNEVSWIPPKKTWHLLHIWYHIYQRCLTAWMSQA